MGLGERIDYFAKLKGLSLKGLAKATDIPYTTLYSLVKRDSQKTDIVTLSKIANALGISWDDLFPDSSLDFEDLNYKSKSIHTGLNLNFDKATEFPMFDFARFSIAMRKLNPEAREIALQRIEEMTEIPKYQAKTDD